MIGWSLLVALALVQPGPAPQKADIVSVTGCVTPAVNDVWTLTNATDPVVEQRQAPTPQRGAAPPAATQPAAPPSGRNRYRLIGILELGIPDHKGHTVTIKGLLVPGTERKINVTSVKMIADSCPK